MTSTEHFSGMCVLRGQQLLYEKYNRDFGADKPHSIQSITKTYLPLIMGRLHSEGLMDLEKSVSEYLPDVGPGYADSTVQQVLDMAVHNNFVEDYSDNGCCSKHGYSRMEVAMG